MAKHTAYSNDTSVNTNDEKISILDAPFEVPGLFTEVSGITLDINSPFQASRQLSSSEPVVDQLEERYLKVLLFCYPLQDRRKLKPNSELVASLKYTKVSKGPRQKC